MCGRLRVSKDFSSRSAARPIPVFAGRAHLYTFIHAKRNAPDRWLRSSASLAQGATHARRRLRRQMTAWAAEEAYAGIAASSRTL